MLSIHSPARLPVAGEGGDSGRVLDEQLNVRERNLDPRRREPRDDELTQLGCHGRRVEFRRSVDPIRQPELLRIVAELIKSLTIGKGSIALKAGALNDLVNIDPAGGNFFAREIPFSKSPS